MGKNFLVVGTDIIPGIEITGCRGFISSSIIAGTNIFSDFFASVSDVFGGKSKSYRKQLDWIRESATDELIDIARDKGCNAIVGFKLDFDEISGQGKQMFMVTATGTAVIAKLDNEIIQNIAEDEVSQDELNQRVQIRNLLDCHSYDEDFLSNSEWKTISEIGDESCLEFAGHFFLKCESEKTVNDFYKYISKINPEVAMDYLYERIDKKCVIELIRELEFFSPERLVKALKEGKYDSVIALLDAEKPVYTLSDCKNMVEICKLLQTMPETVEYISEKASMFAKIESRYWVCKCRCKNPEERDTCSACGKDKTGLSRNDRLRIKGFIKKTKILSEMLVQRRKG